MFAAIPAVLLLATVADPPLTAEQYAALLRRGVVATWAEFSKTEKAGIPSRGAALNSHCHHALNSIAIMP
jgi:hypothetical protein